jgi:gliding motility-associated-like protein
VLNGLPSTGTWTLTRYPGTLTTTGSGTSTTVAGLISGDYNFTITNANGCISVLSATVTITHQPVAPSPPVIGTITQPVSDVPTGSVVLTGLPNSSWILTLSPGNISIPGTGVTKTISGLVPGTYSLTVTNPEGCTSASSASFVISPLPGAPVLLITNPAPVCYPATIDLRNPVITSGSTEDLTYSYWNDPSATSQFKSPESAPNGTFYIKGTASDGQFTVKPVVVQVFEPPVASAGPDQVLDYRFETSMAAELKNSIESGVWSVISGTGEFSDSTYARTTVTGLSKYENIFSWKVTNGICPGASDTVSITVNDLMIPSLITPNMDGKNDCLIIKGSDAIGTTGLIIFDRRGSLIFKSENYDNTWNGLDLYGKPVPDDTYFYIVKSENGKTVKGFVVIRR